MASPGRLTSAKTAVISSSRAVRMAIRCHGVRGRCRAHETGCRRANPTPSVRPGMVKKLTAGQLSLDVANLPIAWEPLQCPVSHSTDLGGAVSDPTERRLLSPEEYLAAQNSPEF